MDGKKRQNYSTACFYTQLKKVIKFRGEKSQAVYQPYYYKINGYDKLFVSKLTWSRFKKITYRPDMLNLILIAIYFKIKIEYFFIKGAKPQDYIIPDGKSRNSKFVSFYEEEKQKYLSSCFGVQLKKVRLFRGFLYQAPVARKLKVLMPVWNLLEKGKYKLNLKQLVIFANFFQVRFEYFLIADAKPEDFALSMGEIKNYSINVFPLQLKKIRLFYSFSRQAAVYNSLNITRQPWSMWESGKDRPNLKNLVLLSNFFKVRIEYFFIPDAQPQDFINNESLKKAVELLKLTNEKQKYSIDDFNIRLRNLRLHYSYIEKTKLISQLNIPVSRWYSWLTNKYLPDYENLVLLADYFNVKIEYFFTKHANLENFLIR